MDEDRKKELREAMIEDVVMLLDDGPNTRWNEVTILNTNTDGWRLFHGSVGAYRLTFSFKGEELTPKPGMACVRDEILNVLVDVNEHVAGIFISSLRRQGLLPIPPAPPLPTSAEGI